jgi:hypothetical protein
MNPIGRIGTCSLMCALACLEPLPAMPASLYLTLAQGINDAGEITGSAIDTATTPQKVDFLAVPVFDGSGNPDIAAKAQANPRQVVLTELCESSFQSSFA